MRAGERAEALLPACYQLLEAVLELLVAVEQQESPGEQQQLLLPDTDALHLMRRVQELAQVSSELHVELPVQGMMASHGAITAALRTRSNGQAADVSSGVECTKRPAPA